MMFSCDIGMEGSAFDDAPATELARILREMATAIEEGVGSGRCIDLNDNTVGAWKVCK